MTDFKPRSKVVLEELLSDQIRPQPTTVVERQNYETTIPDQNTLATRRSGRVIRPPARYRKVGEAHVAISDSSQDDPLTYACNGRF